MSVDQIGRARARSMEARARFAVLLPHKQFLTVLNAYPVRAARVRELIPAESKAILAFAVARNGLPEVLMPAVIRESWRRVNKYFSLFFSGLYGTVLA